MGSWKQVWSDPARRRSILLVSVSVAGTVVAAHRLLGERLPFGLWVLFHALLPTLVFSFGARTAERVTRRLVLRGLATVATVTLGFTLINSYLVLPVWVGIPLNLMVPAIVSTLGAIESLS